MIQEGSTEIVLQFTMSLVLKTLVITTKKILNTAERYNKKYFVYLFSGAVFKLIFVLRKDALISPHCLLNGRKFSIEIM